MNADRRRLEIVHESLLTRWPRLARWRAQDEEGAVLRDQLRQAAQVWDQRHRAEDFLWTGTAFREYQLWRERYPGGLTALEEAFAGAMATHAHRRRRRRQFAVAAVIAALATGLALVAVLRQRAVTETRRAQAEARRAEASKVLALGQLELAANPTVALAYAIKSLELDDSHAARVFAVKALAAGPPAMLHPVVIRESGQVNGVAFSPDGAWAAVIGAEEKVHVLGRDGRVRRHLEAFPSGTAGVVAVFDAASGHLYAAKDGRVRIWRVPDFGLVETQELGGSHTTVFRTPSGIVASTRIRDQPRQVVFAALAPGAAPRSIGLMEGVTNWTFDRTRSSIAFASNKSLYVRPVSGSEPPRRIGAYEGQPGLSFTPSGDVAAYESASRDIRIWSAAQSGHAPLRTLPARFERLSQFTFDGAGKRLATIGTAADGLRVEVLSLDAPVDVGATSYPANFGGFLNGVTFSPDGRWLATANFHAVCFWPTAQARESTLVGHRARVVDLKFTPDNRRLISVDSSGEVREWLLGPGGSSRTLAQVGQASILDVDRRGRFVAVAQKGGVLLVSLDGGKSRSLTGFAPTTWVSAVAIDRDGRRVAAASVRGPRADKVIRVWDLEAGAVSTLGPTENAGDGMVGQQLGIGFLADGSVVSAGDGLRRWSLPGGGHEVLSPSHVQSHLTVFPDGRSVLYKAGTAPEDRGGVARPVEAVWPVVTDVPTRTTTTLRSHGARTMPMTVDPTGSIVVTGGLDGIVRVGPVTGEEPHLLMGHEGWIHTVDVSPDGHWIAAGGDDRAIHIWPMPDMARPPVHTLPRDQLIARLKSLTNLRVVEQSASTLSAWMRTERDSGYELDLEPFPGWANVPEY